MTDTATQPDLAAIKVKQQATWASGDYSVIGTTLQLMGESVCEALDLPAGARVIDVAAGNGNASLAAARRGLDVVATDYVPELLDLAARRAAAEGLALEVRTADAEDLPFEDDSFDGAVSTVGIMFTPDPTRSSSELVRVCRPGARIGLASWTPDGFVGQMFRVVGAHVPPPAGVPSPLLWGTVDQLQALFGAHGAVATEEKTFTFRFRTAEHMVDTFLTFYGPTNRAMAALDDAGQAAFRDALVALVAGANRRTDGTVAVDSTYLEAVVTLG
jgi:SAM-dependent methyltransferase